MSRFEPARRQSRHASRSASQATPAKDGPWIFEIDPSGPSQFQDPIASTGSGYPLAHTALIGVAHFKVEEQSIEGLKAIAYRAIESTCTSSAYGVGMPVQVAVVTKDGVEEMHEGDAVHTELMELIDLWKAKEVEALGSLAPKPAAGHSSAGTCSWPRRRKKPPDCGV